MQTSKVKVIFGPPGTGKTTTLLNILDAELQGGTPPSRIAFVSFTRKAAHEARQRALEKFHLSAKDFLYFRTIHSLAYKRLALRPGDVMQKSDWDEVGERSACRFSGDYDITEGLESLLRQQEGDQVLAQIAVARSRRLHWSAGYDVRAYRSASMSRERYDAIGKAINEYKAKRSLVDFTDMLEHAIGRTAPLDVDVAIIDEAQDLSVLQWDTCDHLFSRAQRVYVAGDDDQAIYRWAGADVRRFQSLRFDEREVLSKSYRLPTVVWREACGILSAIRERVDKDWGPRADDGGLHVLAAPGYAPVTNGEEWLVLARTKYMIKQIGARLFERGIPCTVFGRSSITPKHVAAMSAWRALLRGEPLPLEDVRALYTCMSANAPQDIDFNTMPKQELYTYKRLSADFGLRASLEHHWTAALDGISYSQCMYYERVMEGGRKVTAPPTIHLNTIHGSKGGECDNVLLLTDVTPKQGETLRKPSTTECDDEHRVFYVGTTRARRNLYLARSASSNEYRMPCLTA